MSSYFPFSIISVHALEIALLFFTGGFLILLRSLSTQDQYIQEQRLLIADLQLNVQECRSDQRVRSKEVGQLQQECARLHARQQLVEKHGSDPQRIDLAMRMLKRGSADPDTLHELGLSNSEIKLLVRLHSTPEPRANVSSKNSTSNLSEPLRDTTLDSNSASNDVTKNTILEGNRITVPKEANLQPQMMASQGVRLARLLSKTRVKSAV